MTENLSKKYFKTIFLHIGLEKTGTTTLQEVLWHNRKELEKHGIILPYFLGKNHMQLALLSAGRRVTVDLQNHLKLTNEKKYDNFISGFPSEFEKNISRSVKEASAVKSLILTNEHLSSRVKNVEEAAILKKLLSPFGDTIRIIIYLRRQDSYLVSLYSEFVKSGGRKSFQEWLASFNYINLNWNEVTEVWSTVFGKENITIRPFEKKELKNDDLVADFMDTIGEQYALIRNFREGKSNESLGVARLESLRNMNRFLPAPSGRFRTLIRRLVIFLLRFKGGNKMSISPEIKREILNRYEAGNREVAESYLRRERLFDAE